MQDRVYCQEQRLQAVCCSFWARCLCSPFCSLEMCRLSVVRTAVHDGCIHFTAGRPSRVTKSEFDVDVEQPNLNTKTSFDRPVQSTFFFFSCSQHNRTLLFLPSFGKELSQAIILSEPPAMALFNCWLAQQQPPPSIAEPRAHRASRAAEHTTKARYPNSLSVSIQPDFTLRPTFINLLVRVAPYTELIFRAGPCGDKKERAPQGQSSLYISNRYVPGTRFHRAD